MSFFLNEITGLQSSAPQDSKVNAKMLPRSSTTIWS